MKNRATKIVSMLASLLLVSGVVWVLSGGEEARQVRRVLQSYLTSSTRMRVNQIFCNGVERSTLVGQADINLKEQYMAHFNMSFSVDGNAFYNELSNDWSKAPAKFQEQTKGFALWVGPFALGFVLLLLFLPFLSCCCCCPNCCPSKCCRQEDSKLYTKCELRWPSVMVILALGLAIAAGAYGFFKAKSINETMKKVTCSVAIVPDDLLNGNITQSGTNFFTGLNMLSQSLNWFDGNLTAINNILTKFNSSNSNMTTAISNGNTLLTNIKDTDGNTGSGMTAINYGPPISESSSFPGILGTYNTSGLIYSYYTLVQTIVNSITQLGQNVQTYFNVSATISTSVASAQSNLTSLIDQVNSIDTEVAKYPNASTYLDSVGQYIQIFYAALIGLSALGALGALLMCCCNKDKCRYLMYFSCFFLSIVALVGLLVTTIVSAIIPPMQWGCEFLGTAFSSRFHFSRNFRGLDVTTQNYIATCMPFSDGNIIKQFSTNLDSLNNLTSAFGFLQNVSFASLNTSISTGKTTYLNYVNAYGSSQTSDVSSTAASTLSTYADAANFASCTDPNFALDSYVPSNSQNPTYVSCKVSGNSAGNTECSGNFNPKGGSCFGCLDVASIFASSASGAAVTTSINGRYGNNAGCATFANDMGNIWTNFYNPKQQAIGSSFLNAGVYSSVNSLNIATFQGNLATLDGALTGVSPTINSLNTLLDTKYGMLGGLNCRLFGEDFQTIISTSCVLGYNSLFQIRLALGICCLGLFFASFCAVCAGSRHARQADKRSKTNGDSDDQKPKDNDDTKRNKKYQTNRYYTNNAAEFTLESIRPR